MKIFSNLFIAKCNQKLDLKLRIDGREYVLTVQDYTLPVDNQNNCRVMLMPLPDNQVWILGGLFLEFLKKINI